MWAHASTGKPPQHSNDEIATRRILFCVLIFRLRRFDTHDNSSVALKLMFRVTRAMETRSLNMPAVAMAQHDPHRLWSTTGDRIDAATVSVILLWNRLAATSCALAQLNSTGWTSGP